MLEDIIKEVIETKKSDRITTYIDYKKKYVILNPSVKVEIELPEGKVIKLDVTDLFFGKENN